MTTVIIITSSTPKIRTAKITTAAAFAYLKFITTFQLGHQKSMSLYELFPDVAAGVWRNTP